MTSQTDVELALAGASGEELLRWLDEHARSFLLGDAQTIRLVPWAAAFRACDCTGRPYAALLVAKVICDADPNDPFAGVLEAAADAEFRARGDAAGLGYVADAVASRYLVKGRLQEAAEKWREAAALLDRRTTAGHLIDANLSLERWAVGDVAGAVRQVEGVAREAMLAGSRVAEAMAWVYEGFFLAVAGQFEQAVNAASLAHDAYALVTPEEDRWAWPLADVVDGVVASVRNQRDLARRSFDQAMEKADGPVGTPWIRSIVLSLRAEFTAMLDPVRARNDAAGAARILDEIGDAWWAPWAHAALGVSYHHLGRFELAIGSLTEAIDRCTNPVEQARFKLLRAESRFADGNAAAAVGDGREALRGYLASSTGYWAARTHALLARADGRNARNRHLAELQAISGNDPAYRFLLRGRLPIRVRLLGPAIVEIGGRAVRFPTIAAERATLHLAAAGAAGVRDEVLALDLWPDANTEQARRRFNTLIWQVRTCLGDDFGRIRRHGGRTFFDLDPHECDALDLLAAGAGPAEVPSTDGPGPGAPRWVEDHRAGSEPLRPVADGRFDAQWVDELTDRLHTAARRLLIDP